MKARQYTITAGEYDSFRIVAIVEGSARPALSTLYKQFRSIALNGLSEPIKGDKDPYISAQYLRDKLRVRFAMEKHMNNLGYAGENLAAIFVTWLCDEHEFTIVKSNQFFVDM